MGYYWYERNQESRQATPKVDVLDLVLGFLLAGIEGEPDLPEEGNSEHEPPYSSSKGAVHLHHSYQKIELHTKKTSYC